MTRKNSTISESLQIRTIKQRAYAAGVYEGSNIGRVRASDAILMAECPWIMKNVWGVGRFFGAEEEIGCSSLGIWPNISGQDMTRPEDVVWKECRIGGFSRIFFGFGENTAEEVGLVVDVNVNGLFCQWW